MVCRRGGGTLVASRHRSDSGSMSTAIVPAAQAFFKVMRTRPSGRCSTRQRRAAGGGLLRRLHGREEGRQAGEDAGPAASRRDRRLSRHQGRGEDDRPLPRAGDPGAFRPHRLPGQPRPHARDRRRLRLGSGPPRPGLLRQGRAPLPRGAREVPRSRRAHDRALGQESRRLPADGGGRLRHGEAAR